MDLAHYDKMVDGVVRNVEYCREKVRGARAICGAALLRPMNAFEGGLQKIKTTYDIAVLHMKFRYFMEHEYDPDQKCMVFHLDYSRRSDIDDSVGYWYVQPSGRASSRVYYSCECKLRGWVPGPVYNVLTKEALSKVRTLPSVRLPFPRACPSSLAHALQLAMVLTTCSLAQATTWVSKESVKEWRNQQQNDGFGRFVSGVRDSLDQLKLPRMPEPPVFVSRFMDARRDAAVRFVSNTRLGRKLSPVPGSPGSI
eukprot:scaffold181761_cov35-Tisochrysis_lutea.AAC.2